MDLDPTMKEGEARDFLALFDFRGDEVEQKIATLSGGEKGRLSLARIVFGGANLLLLDEPTNHLDLDARERLEEALSEFEGAIVFVSPRPLVRRPHRDADSRDRPGRAERPDARGLSRGTTPTLQTQKARDEGSRGESAMRRTGAEPQERPAAARRRSPCAAPTAPPRRRRAEGREPASRRSKRRSPRLEEEIRSLDVSLADPDVYRDGEKVRR